MGPYHISCGGEESPEEGLAQRSDIGLKVFLIRAFCKYMKNMKICANFDLEVELTLRLWNGFEWCHLDTND